MASRKEYSMDFVLNAALNGNFKGAFHSAQAEFAKLGSEVRDLNRIQSDVSSYQKQQAAVANTDAKLENLQRQYGLLRQEIGETDGSTAALERQKQRLEATGARLKEAGVDTADLTGESARLAEELEELRARQEAAAESVRAAGQAYQEAGEGAEDFGTRASEAFSAAQQALVSAGIAGALREVKDAYDIDLTYYVHRNAAQSGASIAAAVRRAVEEYIAWQSARLGRDINPSKLTSLLMQTGIKRVDIRSPVFTSLRDGNLELSADMSYDASLAVPQLAQAGGVHILNGGYEDE